MEPLRDTDPDRIGDYRLLGRLGAGGMGQVYLGRSPGSRVVAVKTLHQQHAGDTEFRARFEREVTAARRVSGAFTAPVLDADAHADVPWLVTAYIPGPTLHAAVRAQGPLPVGSARMLGAGLAEALADIHRQGLTHRDLKPANVLLAEDGPRVLDFGIARSDEASRLTITNQAVGTIGYMSPEQLEGEAVGPASDVFSLGAVLAFAALGRSVFPLGGSLAAVVRQVCEGTPDLTDVPAELRPTVSACLAKDPAERPAPAELFQLARDLDTGWLPERLGLMVDEQTARVHRTVSARHPTAPLTEAAAQDSLTPESTAGADLERDREVDVPSDASPAADGAPDAPSTGKDDDELGFWGLVFGVQVWAVPPVLQIPAGWLASELWSWFTRTVPVVAEWDYPGLFTADGFVHALLLGYFLVNVCFGGLLTILMLFNPERDRDHWGTMTGFAITVVGTFLVLRIFGFP
ncbi:serine/threonine protein kinase [Lipingzhangella halophila]|uniref:Serine/threonine protein kinase n=1 Tax=Lipingzhangella halophila TaxID=1783352 RepID=A0A7W7RH26_9ACTN|nr:serine/threonine-protein kinase [Lipingzhangella halophila]MBB4931316.1 serine/threonine protein kinase [Lipingzhangella halophila]